jgi:uncharacterized membrane protein YoaK (UPF0700 family)
MLHSRASRESIALRDHLIIALALSAGATDAMCYLALQGKFSAFMTGNLVFLGLGIVGADGAALPTVLNPICGFAVGAFAATLILNPIRGPQEWPHRVTPVLALTALTHLCFFGLWLAVSGHPSAPVGDGLLALSALGMGLQTAAVLALGIHGVFTTAATATLTILMGNAAHWSKTRPDERVLAGVLIALVAGTACGALLVLHAISFAPLLPLLTTASVVVIAAIAFGDKRFRLSDSHPKGVST